MDVVYRGSDNSSEGDESTDDEDIKAADVTADVTAGRVDTDPPSCLRRRLCRTAAASSGSGGPEGHSRHPHVTRSFATSSEAAPLHRGTDAVDARKWSVALDGVRLDTVLELRQVGVRPQGES